MITPEKIWRGSVIILITSIFGLATGCAYMRDRTYDAKDMVDIGVTFSSKPQFALYYDFIPIFPIGIGKVDGHFIGLGGGEFTSGTPHYQRSLGLILWGEEEVTFKYSEEELDAMPEEKRHAITNFQRSGLAGLAQGPIPGPDYMISCPHYIHLGWIGIVASPRYLQMLDFVLGWFTIDITGDDGRWEEE